MSCARSLHPPCFITVPTMKVSASDISRAFVFACGPRWSTPICMAISFSHRRPLFRRLLVRSSTTSSSALRSIYDLMSVPLYVLLSAHTCAFPVAFWSLPPSHSLCGRCLASLSPPMSCLPLPLLLNIIARLTHGSQARAGARSRAIAGSVSAAARYPFRVDRLTVGRRGRYLS